MGRACRVRNAWGPCGSPEVGHEGSSPALLGAGSLLSSPPCLTGLDPWCSAGIWAYSGLAQPPGEEKPCLVRAGKRGAERRPRSSQALSCRSSSRHPGLASHFLERVEGGEQKSPASPDSSPGRHLLPVGPPPPPGSLRL